MNKVRGCITHKIGRALLAFCLLAQPAYADQEATFNDGVLWAKSISDTKAKINVEDYCATTDLTCKSKVHRPDQVGMTDAQMNNQGPSAYANNAQAQAIQENLDNGRPVIDPNEEIYRMALIGQDNAYEITHGISNAYADCDSGMTCTTDTYPRHCEKPTHNPVHCEKVPYVISGDLTSGLSTIEAAGYAATNDDTFPVPAGTNRITMIIIPKLFHTWTSPDTVNIYLNGVWAANIPTVKSIMYYVVPAQTVVVDVAIPKTNTVLMTYSSSQTTRPWSFDPLSIQWQAGENVMGWKTTCNGLLPECKKTKETCTEAGETRLVNGIWTTLPCWRYELTYLCETTDTCLPDLPIITQTCKTVVMGTCIEDDITQEVEEKTCKEGSLICGETSFCLEGDCYEATPTQSDNFDEAAAMMAAVSAAAEDVGDPPLLFTGSDMRCSIKAAGLANCCRNGGWGTDINVTSCSPEEKALNAAQTALLTIPLGSYCAEHVLGVCIRKKRSYCTFDSKLARIVQEQGRPQIGRGFGSAKAPDCSAITPEEMQQMDFSQMDFSDFYDDMHDNTNIPSPDEIKGRMQSAHGD
jgi:type-F conjugative transfer system mating-pair stabilization protein TraN